MASPGILLDSVVDQEELSRAIRMDSDFTDFDFGTNHLLESSFDDPLALANMDSALWNSDALLGVFDEILDSDPDQDLSLAKAEESVRDEPVDFGKMEELFCSGSPVNEVEISSESNCFSSEYSGDNSGSDSDTATSSVETIKLPNPSVQPQRITKVIKKITAPQKIAPKPASSKYYRIQAAPNMNSSVKTVKQIIVPKPIGKVKDPNTVRIIRNAAQIIPALTNVVTTIIPQAVTQTMTTLQSPMQFFVTPSTSTTGSTSESANGQGPFKLSDEEKRLLAKEGIHISDKRPLSKAEERELKRIRRKIRNKISAQDSRKRKKEYIDLLEDQVRECNKEKDQMAKRISQLESQNKTLAAQLRKLQSLLSSNNGKPTQASTCMLVLMLSMALLLVPNMKSEKDSTSLTEEGFQLKLPTGVRSRTLLQNTLLDGMDSLASDDDFAVSSSEEESLFEGEEIVIPGPFKRRLAALLDHDYVAPYPRKKRSRVKGPSSEDAVQYDTSSDSGLDSPGYPGSPAGKSNIIEDGVFDPETILSELFNKHNRTEQQGVVFKMPIDEAYLG